MFRIPPARERHQIYLVGGSHPGYPVGQLNTDPHDSQPASKAVAGIKELRYASYQ